ncbi:MAG TPA: hypothetical protein VMR95_03815 [Candidatus Binatia bacterium]|jgi:hypothetical protein|nr:hypothetical protein [Candidatus Binatia bacterium]
MKLVFIPVTIILAILLGGIIAEVVDTTVYTSLPGTPCQVVNNIDNAQVACLVVESPARLYGWPYTNGEVIEGNLLSPSEKLTAEQLVNGTFQADIPLVGGSLPFSGFVGNWIAFSFILTFVLLLLLGLTNTYSLSGRRKLD